MSAWFENKVAFITGVARAQGREHAVRLAKEGVDIIGVDLCEDVASVPYPLATKDDLAETVRLVEAEGRRIVTSVTDVRDLAAMKNAVNDGVRALGGRLDFVLANAGVASLADMDEAGGAQAWSDVIDINLTGVWNTAVATVEHLKSTGPGGSMVLTSSTAAFIGVPSMRIASYVASKHALVGLMRCLALTLAPEFIRVNTVHPTGVATPFVMNEAFGGFLEANPAVGLKMSNALPVEMVEASDVTEAVLWLLSDAARYVTGSTMTVDAGSLVR